MAIAELAKEDPEGDAVRYRYFIAAPMSGLPKAEYPAFRRWVMEVVALLEAEHDAPVYFAGRDLSTADAFSSPAYAAAHDLKALKASEEFVLFYPKQCHSSAIFEVGVAVALGLNVTIFTPDRSELIFMLRSPEAYSELEWAGAVRLIEYGRQLPVASEAIKTL